MDLLTGAELSADEIYALVEKATTLKANPQGYADGLEGKILAMLFQKTSTRTRVSFEAAMAQLRGHAIYLGWEETNLDVGALEDEIRCIDRYVDAIMARVNRHADLVRIALAASAPVINGLSDQYHPCQTLADLVTIQEKLGSLEGIRLAFVGDGNNVCNSLIVVATKVGVSVTVATPPGYEPMREAVETGLATRLLTLTHDPKKAVAEADIVYTDAWVSLGKEAEQVERKRVFRPYQINRALLGDSRPLIMHCLPAHRGNEITDELLDSPQSIVFDQAENRLHAQKALLLKLLG